MSVFVSDFKPGVPGGWTIAHDDGVGGSHDAPVTATDVAFGKQLDGSPDYRLAVVTCPVCGAVSTHPMGGGSAPRSVQEMFVRMLIRVGCPCGALTAGKTPALVIAHARNHVIALEGTGRWQVASIVP